MQSISAQHAYLLPRSSLGNFHSILLSLREFNAKKQYILWKDGFVERQSVTNFVIICLLFSVLIAIICLKI